jgi:hypothetical protein
MTMATGKREKNFDRNYSDSEGVISIGHEGDTVAEIALNSVNPDVLTRSAMRYLADIVVGVGNAALKAEGGTIETATAKMAETVKALQDGTFRFRSATGQGGLSLEDEQGVIADTLVSLGKAATKEDAQAKVAAVYARTKTNAKGYTVRPDYNALKAAPQIKAALATASKAGDNLDSLLSA